MSLLYEQIVLSDFFNDRYSQNPPIYSFTLKSLLSLLPYDLNQSNSPRPGDICTKAILSYFCGFVQYFFWNFYANKCLFYCILHTNGLSNFINVVVTYPSKKETIQNIVRQISEKNKNFPKAFLSFFPPASEKAAEYVQKIISTGIYIMPENNEDNGTKRPRMP